MRAVRREARWVRWSMRVAWLAVLLVGVGCRAVPETASGSREMASSARPIASTANVGAAHSDIVPVAFSIELARDARPDGDDPLTSGDRRPTSRDNAASPGEPVVPAVPMSLTLGAAIQTALARNPDLVAVRSSEPVAHAAYHVAKTYPFNPQFQTQVLPYTRGRNCNDAPVSQQHVIVQTFELAGQSRFRSGAAAAKRLLRVRRQDDDTALPRRLGTTLLDIRPRHAPYCASDTPHHVRNSYVRRPLA